MLSASGDSEPASLNARFVQALAAKSLEIVRLIDALSASPSDETAHAALAEHLSDLRQSAGELGFVHLEGAVADALRWLERESFSQAALAAVRVLALRYPSLALIPSQSGMHPVVEEEPPVVQVSLRGRRVLVADEQAEVRWFYVGVLRDAGARVTEARDGAHALELARDDAPDLILADMDMPRLDGLGLCAALRREPALDGVPVVLLSRRIAAQQILARVSRELEPLSRLEQALKGEREASGDLDGLGVPRLLRVTRRIRPTASIVLQDAWSLFELDLHEGRLVRVARTAIDGELTVGAAALPALVGMSSGRFVVAEGLAAEVAGQRESLDASFALACRGATEPLPGPSDELIAPEIEQDSQPVADSLERENVRAQSAVAMHREPANQAPPWNHPIWRRHAGAMSHEGVSGFGMELQSMPRVLGFGFVILLLATVGLLTWYQVTPDDSPTGAPPEAPGEPRATAADEPIAPVMPAAAREVSSGGSDLSAFAGSLRPSVDPSLAVAEGQGALELIGSGDVSVDVDGVGRGALPVTLLLDEGRHTVRYRIGARTTYRFYYVKSGATRTVNALTRAGGLVDAR